MRKKHTFLIWIIAIFLIILTTYCGSSTGPDISDFEIYYFSSDNLDAAADSTGLIIIVFRNASGEDEEIRAEMPEAEDTTLYNESGYTLELWVTGGIYYLYPITGGSRAYAVSTKGIAVEHEKLVDENTYMAHFIDTTSGDTDYTADIVADTGDVYLAIFRDPINDTVEVDVNPANTRYLFEFDNEAGTGTVRFRTDPEGYVFIVERL